MFAKVVITMNITKKIIADHVNKKFGLSHKICNDFISGLCEEIIDLSIQYGSITITNFGKFYLHTSKERIGYNINKNIKVTIPPRQVLRFQPALKIKNIVNKIL